MHGKRVIIIGGGAAGFFCAVNAARLNPSLSVTIIEKSGKLLSKVKVSGGGRCNVTHACFDIDEMSKRYPRGGNFVKKTFHRFFTTDTVKWFEEKGVKLKAEGDGRMFPVTDSSQTIIDCLLKEANRYSVNILMNAEVEILEKEGEEFQLVLSNGRVLAADFVCVASGGYPKSSMFGWLQKTGHATEEPVPSLFTFNLPKHPITQLMGVSVENARVRVTDTKFGQEGPLLITHWGLSGPAILKLSAWGARALKEKNYDFTISVNWLDDMNENELREVFAGFRHTDAAKKIIGKNTFGLPNRLWDFLAENAGVQKKMRWADLPTSVQRQFIQQLTACEFSVKGKTTFKEEFVTAGGIKLNEIDHTTMMSRKVNNLFFAGEVLDVDGITGGYNFQHAWTSGFIAADAIAKFSM